jgi:lipopolysaccharide/colanic/teichoic acid biosynthesis glycosyltransferase
MRLASRTSTVKEPDCGTAIDHAVGTTDRAPVFLFARAGKRALDIVAATAGLILLSPTFLLVSIAIKIESRGPLFHPHALSSYNNENISLLKFRTTTFSETRGGTSTVTRTVTRVGHVLHRTRLDGLPQLVNVLRGEMSVVGPSPRATASNLMFAEQISLIQKLSGMKPGLTGWAQVNGCSGTRQRTEFDLHYIENWSFLFDLKIILMTLFSKTSYLD